MKCASVRGLIFQRGLFDLLLTAVSWAILVCFSSLVGSLVASVLIRLVWAGASEYVFSLDFGTRDYNI